MVLSDLDAEEVVGVAWSGCFKVVQDVLLEFINKGFVAKREKIINIDGYDETQFNLFDFLYCDERVRVGWDSSHSKLLHNIM